MNILLLGKNGQLGWELQRTLALLGSITALGRAELDLEDATSIRDRIRELKPDLIVNAAAYTKVDQAESEPEKAYAVNAAAPGIIAEEAKALGAFFIHYSTDYVFDGTKGQPYVETDAPNPLNVYGASKLAGERAVQAVDDDYLILRTAWVYSLRGDNFVTKVLKWARTKEILRIVDDQVSNPTWARMLAEVTAQVLTPGIEKSKNHTGLYHLAGEGYTSRFEWARQILAFDPARHQQIAKDVLPVRTDDFPSPANRPLFSALNCSRFVSAVGLFLPSWNDSLLLAAVE